MTARVTLVIAVVGVTLCTVTPVRAQHADPLTGSTSRWIDPVSGITLAAAIDRALEAEPGLEADRLEVDVARGERLQAGLRPNPMTGFEQQVEAGGGGRVTRVSFELPLDLRRRRSRVVEAERIVDVRREEAADQARRLAAAVRRQYGLAALAAREVEVADEIVSAARESLAIVRAAVEAGRMPPLDRDVLAVEVRRLEAMRAMAAGRAEAAFIMLGRLLGMPPAERPLLATPIETLIVAPPTVTTSVGRPDLRAAEARVNLTEAGVVRAMREGALDASFFGMYMRTRAGFPQMAFGPTGVLEPIRGVFHAVAGGVSVQLPLFNRQQGRVAAARSAADVARTRQQAVELAAEAELADAEVRAVAAAEALALFDAEIRALARRNLDVVRQSANLGRATVLDILAEQRRLLEIEREYTEALGETWEARSALMGARGDMP